MKKNRPLTKPFLAAAKMPPLKHYVDRTEPFDITKSEVAEWLIRQPTILNALVQHYNDRGAIVFNPETQLWQGRDFQE